MSDIAIRIDGLGKRYRLGAGAGGGRYTYRTLRDVLTDALAAPVRGLRRLSGRKAAPRERRGDNILWALKDISLEIKQGEVVGIIGRNGAGKSTLLKVLSRITEPTEGRVELHGRVGSILEVGTGFHPELTGRENIYLNGAILGMTRREIAAKFDEIVAFAETEKFLETPVKRYSSGMYVRLAFAVAAHLEPEILVVDEVLSVGDVAFQRKCLGKMGDAAVSGKTVLFVSHNIGAIQQLCGAAVLLEGGQVTRVGPTEGVVTDYLSRSAQASDPAQIVVDPDLPAQVTDALLWAPRGQVIDVYDPVTLHFELLVRKPLEGVSLYTELLRNGTPLLVSLEADDTPDVLSSRSPGRYCVTIALPAPLLKPGWYSLNLALGRPGSPPLQILTGLLNFEVDLLSRSPTLASCAPHRPGVVAVPLRWATRAMDDGSSLPGCVQGHAADTGGDPSWTRS